MTIKIKIKAITMNVMIKKISPLKRKNYNY